MSLAYPAPASGNVVTGIVCLIAGIAIFSLQDLILKWVSGDYPLHQAMVLRSITAIPFLMLFVSRENGLASLRTPRWRQLVGRGLVMFVAYTCYYLALASLPIATTVALYFVAPLFITLLSVLFLSETVGPRRWLAVIGGFAGVLIVLRPGSDLFDWASLLPIISGLCYGASMVMARRMGQGDGAAVLAFYGNTVFLACATGLALVFGGGAFASESHASLGFLLRGWAMPTTGDLLLMLACGPIAAAGLTLLTQAYRIAQANIVAPFEYTALLWGVLWGWLFWRDWPDTISWLGISVIMGAGLYILYRERVATGRQTR